MDLGHLSQERAKLGATDQIPGRLGGWEILPRVAIGPSPAGPLRVDFALLHPRRGVALVDLAPRSTPKAVETLRRSLRAARSPGASPGHLPIVYCCLASWELRDLVALLDAAFAKERPLTLTAGDTWMGMVQRLMRADGPDGPAPATAAPERPAGPRRSWAPAGLLAVAAVAFLVARLVAAGPDGLPLPSPPPVPEVVALAPRGLPPGMAGAAMPGGGTAEPPAPPAHDEAPPAALAEPAWGEEDPAPAIPAAPAAAEPPAAPAPPAAIPLQAAAPPPEGPTDTAEPPAWGPPPTGAAAPRPASTAEMTGTEAAPALAEEPDAPPPPATAAPGPMPAPTASAAALAAQPSATARAAVAGAAAWAARRPRPAAAEPPPAAAPATPSPTLERQCLALLARAQLGEEPSLADRSRLRTACAPRP